jgi:hypothetical protein
LPDLLFLTGWPACGQAFYGEWLASAHGFHNVNLDEDSSDESELRILWRRYLPRRAPALIKHLLKSNSRWVVTGSAPAEHLDHLSSLQAAGFHLWFLQPRDESLSRLTWLRTEREFDEKAPASGWQKRADAIRQQARQLRPFFRDRCITTLLRVGELMPVEELSSLLSISPTSQHRR